MSSGGLSSLLKYRFVNKSERVSQASSSSSPVQSTPNGLSQDTDSSSTSAVQSTPNGLSQTTDSSVQVIPETPSSKQTSPESPVFRTKYAALAVRPRTKVSRLVISDDEDDDNGGFSSSWMSKEKAMQTNGALRTYGKNAVCENSDESDDEEQGNDQNGHSHTVSTPDFKGKRRRDEMSQESVSSLNSVDSIDLDSYPPPAKHRRIIRRLSSESSQDISTQEVPAASSDASQEGVVVQSEKKSSSTNSRPAAKQTDGDKIRILITEFPYVEEMEIRETLYTNNWDLAAATQHLTEEADKLASGQDSDIAEIVEIDEDEEAEYDDDDASDEEQVEKMTAESNLVLTFFEEATLEELYAMPGCSKRKAELVLTMRPFETYEKLVERFEENKTYNLISSCWDIIQIREVIMKLMQKCQKIGTDLEALVDNLMHSTTLDDNQDQIMHQPECLNPKMQMKPYQLVGLNWLRLIHRQELNGILADEMGLGKTIQAIAFLGYLLEQGEDGPHVIIVPSSTIENWKRELELWCPRLEVLLYYGTQEERKHMRMNLIYNDSHYFNVLLTTYNMTSGSLEDRSLFKKVEFHYAIFDEGHMLKNMSSQRHQNLMRIAAERRLLLTGTPLQNNLLELMSLLCFVMPDMFEGKTESLKKMFTMISRNDESRGSYEKERIAHAKRIMKPFLLRRLKSEVLQQLPKKVEEIVQCTMIPDQEELYNQIVYRASQSVKNDDKTMGATAGSAILMQLRKAANHPLLHRKCFTDEKLKKMAEKISKEPSHRDRGALPGVIYEDLEIMSDFELHKLCDLYPKHIGEFRLNNSLIEDSGKFRILDTELEDMKERGDRVLLFSQFTMVMDIIQDFLKLRNYSYYRLDGSTPVVERQTMIDNFNKNKDVFIFLLSTRAGGLGINLTAANVVIIHDIDYNPYNDKQAEDRCHRVGQTREVRVVRLISQGTVEEAMLRCAQSKLRLEKDITVSDMADGEADTTDVVSLLQEALAQKAVSAAAAAVKAAEVATTSTSAASDKPLWTDDIDLTRS